MPIKLTDTEVGLVIQELALDPNSQATKALKKLLWNYCVGLDVIEANREVCQGIPLMNFSEYEGV